MYQLTSCFFGETRLTLQFKKFLIFKFLYVVCFILINKFFCGFDHQALC